MSDANKPQAAKTPATQQERAAEIYAQFQPQLSQSDRQMLNAYQAGRPQAPSAEQLDNFIANLRQNISQLEPMAAWTADDKAKLDECYALLNKKDIAGARALGMEGLLDKQQKYIGLQQMKSDLIYIESGTRVNTDSKGLAAVSTSALKGDRNTLEMNRANAAGYYQSGSISRTLRSMKDPTLGRFLEGVASEQKEGTAEFLARIIDKQENINRSLTTLGGTQQTTLEQLEHKAAELSQKADTTFVGAPGGPSSTAEVIEARNELKTVQGQIAYIKENNPSGEVYERLNIAENRIGTLAGLAAGMNEARVTIEAKERGSAPDSARGDYAAWYQTKPLYEQYLASSEQAVKDLETALADPKIPENLKQEGRATLAQLKAQVASAKELAKDNVSFAAGRAGYQIAEGGIPLVRMLLPVAEGREGRDRRASMTNTQKAGEALAFALMPGLGASTIPEAMVFSLANGYATSMAKTGELTPDMGAVSEGTAGFLTMWAGSKVVHSAMTSMPSEVSPGASYKARADALRTPQDVAQGKFSGDVIEGTVAGERVITPVEPASESLAGQARLAEAPQSGVTSKPVTAAGEPVAAKAPASEAKPATTAVEGTGVPAPEESV
ncbi:MAG: hypothetical protein WCG06_05615, partial [Candidatus Omnitrophota bacterium]